MVEHKEKIIKIGRFHIDITRISAKRTIEAKDRYNKLCKSSNKEDRFILLTLVSIVVSLIRIDFSILNILEYIKRLFISRAYILKVSTIEELDDICKEVLLQSFLSNKKKEAKLTEMGIKIMENLTDEQLKKLLSNYVS